MSKRLFVGNLLYRITDSELRDFFSQIGKVIYARVIRFKDTGKSRGFGFVEMANEEDAKKAIGQLNGKDFKGRKIVVAEAKPKG